MGVRRISRMDDSVRGPEANERARRFKWWAAAAGAGVILSVAGLAVASGPPPVTDRGYPPPGVTVTGIGRVDVQASNRDGEHGIRRAVATATKAALPRAMSDARRQAQLLGDASGIRLGEVWAVERDPNLPYPGSGLEPPTPFGNGRYCGTLRRFAGYRTTPDGRRVRRHVSRRACRAPRDVSVYLTVTFAQG